MKLKEPFKNIDLENRVFKVQEYNFPKLALEVFQFQYAYNRIYRQYCDLLKTDPNAVDSIQKIPFLPISFFRTHTVVTTDFDPAAIFESSGTSGQQSSKHVVKDLSLYRKSFARCFERFYGPPEGKCILALLPSYLERTGSSLVVMMDELIKRSYDPLSGFYLYDHDKLQRTLRHNELLKRPTLLIGISFALLDFAEKFSFQLRYTTVMETGGMKGRRTEMTRQQLHQELREKLGIVLVHSEYGMTELLSQAYSKGDGIFHCPPWMKVLAREEDDPLQVTMPPVAGAEPVFGALNIIDLANIFSCSFIATEDQGRLHANGSFEVLGRMEASELRGCSLMLA